jgi:hypothetical protein
MAIERPDGLCQGQIAMKPSEIDPATFRFVAQCLNHCATACPQDNSKMYKQIAERKRGDGIYKNIKCEKTNYFMDCTLQLLISFLCSGICGYMADWNL